MKKKCNIKQIICARTCSNYSILHILLFSWFFTALFLMSSCKNSLKKGETSEEYQMEAAIVVADDVDDIIEDNIDIPIAINLSHTEDENLKELVAAEYEVTRETNDDIYIKINSEYNKKYISGNRFNVSKIAFFENSENVEYLNMNLDLVNNTNEKLSIDELNVIVNESTPDTIPIIYICTTESYSNCIYFVNESWFNWKGFTFSYSIMKKDESFSGNYKKHSYIPFFESYTIVDLLPDMKEMGYDFDEVVNSLREYNIERNREGGYHSEIEPWVENENESNLCFFIPKDDPYLHLLKDKFQPFELKEDNQGFITGTAKLYGSLEFDNSHFKVDFIADISLSTLGGGGALSYANDKFDVELKSLGKDYKLRYPYTTVIEPNGAEMIKLTIKADKSSSHKFYIDVKNDNGLKIRSKDIHFHYYYPKN